MSSRADQSVSDQGVRNRLGWLQALGASGAVVVIWTVVLPWLGGLRPIREHIDSLEAADINASAMFYSELDCQYMLKR